jgi:glycerol kinase
VSLALGADVGSQSVKVVLVDEGGDVVATGSAALAMTHEHDGWAKQDPPPLPVSRPVSSTIRVFCSEQSRRLLTMPNDSPLSITSPALTLWRIATRRLMSLRSSARWSGVRAAR